jgi:hypothetical protein
MAGHFIANEELNKLDLNTDNLFGIMQIYNFIIDKYKQILLLLLVFLIIYVVDYLTYYNNLFYAMAPNIPGVTQKPPDQNKSNTFKKNHRKLKK